MKNPLVIFFVGAAMLIGGLFWLTNIIQVSSMFGSGFNIAGNRISGGVTLIPLICGIVWMFFNPKSIPARILSVIGIGIIVLSVILSVRFQVSRINLFEFILIFVFIAGGSGMVLRVLFVDHSNDRGN